MRYPESNYLAVQPFKGSSSSAENPLTKIPPPEPNLKRIGRDGDDLRWPQKSAPDGLVYYLAHAFPPSDNSQFTQIVILQDSFHATESVVSFTPL